jgi:dethiobiotin synthetase
MSARPAGLIVVTGTGTGVGKTFFGAVTLGLLRGRGVAVAARKPAESFGADDHPTDSEVLAAATGEEPGVVCLPHRRYEQALAPPMAAEALKQPAFTIADLVGELRWPDGVRIGVVEGAGGPRSPLAVDGDTVDLVDALAPDLVVIVAEPELGVINAVRLAAAAFGPRPLVVALNRFDEHDPMHTRNHDWLALRDKLDIVTSPTALAERLVP